MLIPALLSCVALGDVLVPGMPAPAFTADASIKGAEVKALAPGKVHVVEFWATWCGPCIGSMPHLTQLQKSNPDVMVIGVAGFERGNDVAAKEKKVRDFIAAKPERADYTIVFDGDGTMANEWMQAARRNSIPTAFVVGMDGKIAYIGSPDANLDAAVAKAKGAAAPRTANQPMVAGPADDSGNGKGAAPAKSVTVTAPERTVEVTEEPTTETGSSKSTSTSTESKSTTVNGVSTTETTTVETVVEVRDGKRRTTVTRTVTRSNGENPVPGKASSSASGSASGRASSGGSSGSSSSSSSGSSSGSSTGSGNTPR